MKVIYRRTRVRSWAITVVRKEFHSLNSWRSYRWQFPAPPDAQRSGERIHTCQAAYCCHPSKVHWGGVKSPQWVPWLARHSPGLWGDPSSLTDPPVGAVAAPAVPGVPLGAAVPLLGVVLQGTQDTHQAEITQLFSQDCKKFGFLGCCLFLWVVRKNCSCLIFAGSLQCQWTFILFTDMDSMLFTHGGRALFCMVKFFKAYILGLRF